MQVNFIRWCLDPNGRKAVAVNPQEVVCVEARDDSWRHAVTDEFFPSSSTIIMKNKKEYLVQGAVEWVVGQLNGGEQ
jgi:hypothetical protein